MQEKLEKKNLSPSRPQSAHLYLVYVFFSQIDICPKKINRLCSENLAVKNNINKIISGFLGSKFFETHTVVSVVYNPPPHGLQTPNEAFFIRIPKLLGLDR